MNEQQTAARSPHVELRDVTDDDLPIFYEHQLDLEANRMVGFAPRDWDAFSAHWAKARANETGIIQAVVADGQVAGNIVSWIDSGHREVGYWIGRDHWGQGIATKALAAFLSHVSERPLYAYVAKHNIGSRRVLEKCSFVIVGEGSWPHPATGETLESHMLRLDG